MCGTADRSEMHIYYSNRCAARMQLGNLDGALEDAMQCTKLSSRWAKGWSRLGTCQMQKVCTRCLCSRSRCRSGSDHRVAPDGCGGTRRGD